MALGMFKSGQRRVLVATDVAARGLDVKAVKMVINFDPPNRDEDYVHRVGRTGRAGQKGVAIALLTNEDGTAARFIADIMKRGNLPVPQELERRLASGELTGPSGRSRSAGPGRRLGGGLGIGSRRGIGGDPSMDDFDFGDIGNRPSSDRFGERDRFGDGLGGGRGFGRSRDDMFANGCMTDCPT